MSVHTNVETRDPSEPPYDFAKFKCPNCNWPLDFDGEWEEGGVVPENPVYEFYCTNCKAYVTFEPEKEEEKEEENGGARDPAD